MTGSSGTNLIRPREREAVLSSLRAGVVPRSGQHHIAVGRSNEVSALMGDIDLIADGGSAIRFVVGEYGAGKSFFLNLVRSIALEKKLVTLHADLSPARRLHATSGQARSLYAEMMRNLATKAKPEGGAMSSVVERFITESITVSDRSGAGVDAVIKDRLRDLSEMTGGFDFADVIASYWRGHNSGSDQMEADSIRWLRGEFSTKTDARAALGVRTIIDDGNFYDQLKLFAKFVKMAGFNGVLVCLDEMVNLYKLANTQARNSNYEQILRILNDCLQGTSEHIGFVMGGTPEMMFDTRRGIYSYPALASRLAENAFVSDGIVDFSGPIIKLASLEPEDMYVLLDKIRHVFAGGDPGEYLVPDEALGSFMAHCRAKIGDSYFRTPRNTVKEFVQLLSVLEQNPGAEWQSFIDHVDIEADSDPDSEDSELVPLSL